MLYLNKDWIIWDCAYGEGLLVKTLREKGFNATGDRDEFFNPTKQYTYDCIVTNPPFSKKDQFLAKCYEIGKPFALLLPITALEGTFRQSLYKKYGLQILFLKKRIDFTGKKAPWFAVAWFTYKFNLPKDLMFGEL